MKEVFYIVGRAPRTKRALISYYAISRVTGDFFTNQWSKAFRFCTVEEAEQVSQTVPNTWVEKVTREDRDG